MKRGALALALAISSGCAAPSPSSEQSAAPVAFIPQSAESKRLTAYYAGAADALRAKGRFRTEYDPPDAPFDGETLVRNFARIAQRSETHRIGSRILVAGTSIPILRWDEPLRVHTIGLRERDAAHLADLQQRITRLTGLEVETAGSVEASNLQILMLDEKKRAALYQAFEKRGWANKPQLTRNWPTMDAFPCIAQVFRKPDSYLIDFAIILIKDELGVDYRRACMTEEVVQSLGLFNDGPDIRPSIFNDDAEFIELTRHDEYLLRILYDRRLRPGMSRDEAEPIVRMIAAELMAEART